MIPAIHFYGLKELKTICVSHKKPDTGKVLEELEIERDIKN